MWSLVINIHGRNRWKRSMNIFHGIKFIDFIEEFGGKGPDVGIVPGGAWATNWTGDVTRRSEGMIIIRGGWTWRREFVVLLGERGKGVVVLFGVLGEGIFGWSGCHG